MTSASAVEIVLGGDMVRFGPLPAGLRRRVDARGQVRYGLNIRSRYLPRGGARRWLAAGTSREEAERLLREVLDMIDRARLGLPVAEAEAALDSFRSVADGYVETLRVGGCTPDSVKECARTLHRAAESFGATPIVALSPDDIRRFLYGLLRSSENLGGLSPASVRNYRKDIHGCFQYAIRVRRLLRHNPVEAVEPPAPDDAYVRRRASFWAIEPRDDARLLDALDPLVASCAALSLYHGQRRRAVALIRIADDGAGSDLDLLGGTIRFRGETLKRRRRNRRPRADIVRPLSRFARPYVVRQYHRALEIGSPWLHPSPVDPEKPVDLDELSRDFTAQARAVGFASAYLHGLVHIFTSRFKLSGLDDVEEKALRAAMEARGHDSPEVTARYVHHGDDAVFALYRRFDEWMAARLAQDSAKTRPSAAQESTLSSGVEEANLRH